MGRRGISIVLAVAACAVQAGCGGSATLTAAQFTAKAETLCSQMQAQRSELMRETLAAFPAATVEHVPAQEEAQLAAVGPYEDATRGLEKLSPPEEEDEAVKRLLGARKQAAIRVREAPATAYFSSYPYREANELAKAAGLDECAV